MIKSPLFTSPSATTLEELSRIFTPLTTSPRVLLGCLSEATVFATEARIANSNATLEVPSFAVRRDAKADLKRGSNKKKRGGRGQQRETEKIREPAGDPFPALCCDFPQPPFAFTSLLHLPTIVARVNMVLKYAFDVISPYAWLGFRPAQKIATKYALKLEAVPVLFAGLLK
jgi:hypothetical protein